MVKVVLAASSTLERNETVAGEGRAHRERKEGEATGMSEARSS